MHIQLEMGSILSGLRGILHRRIRIENEFGSLERHSSVILTKSFASN